MCIVSEPIRNAIYRCLVYSSKYMGRGMRESIPILQVEKGDRLEPTPDLPNVGDFENASLPLNVTFWRMFKLDRVTHDSPLWWIPGVTFRIIGIDLLHAWHLGGCAVFIGHVLMMFLLSGVLQPKLPWLGEEDCMRIGLNVLRSRLTVFYNEQARADPTWAAQSSRVSNVTLESPLQFNRGPNRNTNLFQHRFVDR